MVRKIAYVTDTSPATSGDRRPYRLSFCHMHPYRLSFCARYPYQTSFCAHRPYRGCFSAARPYPMAICPPPLYCCRHFRTSAPTSRTPSRSRQPHAREQARSQNGATLNRPAIKLMSQPHANMSSNNPCNSIHMSHVENLRRRHRHCRYSSQTQSTTPDRIGTERSVRRMMRPAVVLNCKARTRPIQVRRNGLIIRNRVGTRNRQRYIQLRPRKPIAAQPNRQTQQQHQTRLHG